MAKIKIPEKFIFGLLIGCTCPILLGMLAIVAWLYLDRNEAHALICLLVGISLGVIIDVMYLKMWIRKRYELPIGFIVGIYLFYNVCVFGFFMGFPVFNLLAGIPAGYYAGKRISHKSTPIGKHPERILQVGGFTTLVMALICVSSACIALIGNGVGHEVQSMLRLDREVTQPMIWGIIIVGGTLLICLEYVITRFMMNKTLKGKF
jgi:lipid-A-disaccharide synthase-like uncharacterized protein